MQEYGLKVLDGDLNKAGEKIESAEGVNIDDIVLPLPSPKIMLPENEG